MAGRSDIQAGRAFVELFVKDGLFRRGLALAQARLKTFESGLKQMSERFTTLGRGVGFFGLSLATGLGLAISRLAATRTALQPLTNAWGEMSTAVGNLVVAVAEALSPSIMSLLGTITQLIGSLTEWVRNNQAVVQQAARILAGVTAAAVGVALLGAAFKIAAAAAGILAAVLGGLSGVVPVILALGAAAIAMQVDWGAAVASVQTILGDLQATATETFAGISASIAAGDLAGAVRIAWLGVKVAWLQGTDYILGIWDEFTTTIRKAFTLASSWIADVFLGTMGLITRAINGAITLLNKIPGVEISAVEQFDAEAAAQTLREDTQRAIERRLAAQQQRATEREAAINEARAALSQESTAAKAKAAATTPGIDAVTQAALLTAMGLGFGGIGLGGQGEITGLTQKVETPGGPGSAGTFSAVAAMGLGGGGPQERAAKAAESSDKRLKELNTQIATTNALLAASGLVFI